MTGWSRRRFLTSAGLAGTALAVGACDTAPSQQTTGQNSADGPITWWDHTPNLQQANARIFDKFESEPDGRPVQYTYHQTAKLGQALQLAKQGKQLPDVHSLAGLQLPPPTLIEQGWLQPLELSDDSLAKIPEGRMLEGVNKFDGKVYTIPIFSDKQYWAATWFNTKMLAAADVEPPTTYEQFRQAARKVQNATEEGTYGWIFNLGMPPRVAEHVNYLAQAAGFEGFGGQLYKTGEFAYHDDAYLTVIEFLLSLQQDGLLLPGSQTLDDQTGRVRWAAGSAAFFIDGPWCPGSLNADAPQALDQIDVAPMLVPEAGMPVTAYRTPTSGMFWLAKTSKKVGPASKLLSYQTERQYHIDIANGMAQPPADLSVIEEADVHPAWRKLVGWYSEQAFLAPSPAIRNPDVSKVLAESEPVEPGLGTIVQGMFSGDVRDVRGALKQLSDKSQRSREAALAKAKKAGAKVELDDWAFPGWKPRQDFTSDLYN